MNKGFIILCAIAITITACKVNQDNNKALDYDVLDVNFSVKTTGFKMPANSIFGVAAYCARDNKVGVQMGEKSISSYSSLTDGETFDLIKSSASDLVQANASDHSYKFYVIYPYSSNVDVNAIPAEVPSNQLYADGIMSYLPFTAVKKVTSVVPTVEFDATTPFSVLNLSVPSDIVEEGKPSTLKSLVITPSTPSNFSGPLAGSGEINADSCSFVLSSNHSNSITVTFPDGGLKLSEANTVIPVVILPLTVPADGFDIEFNDIDGSSNQTSFLSQDSDAGTMIVAGSIYNVNITRSSDGVVPVTFPVVFPVDRVNGETRFSESLQPKWVSDGYWSCQDQPQAYCQWNKVSDPSDIYSQVREVVTVGATDTRNIAAPGVKGVWTGDYWEFVIPVKKFAAGTILNIKFPYYGRQAPVFWNIKYLDGENWKICDEHNEVCYDSNYSMNCSFSLPYDKGIIVEKAMKFDNEVKSGYLRIRLECADGSIQGASGACAVRSIPWTSGTGYGAPYYMWCKGSDVHGVYFSIN